MNTVRRCVLIALFALLARPALAAPGAASLIAPSGDVVGTTIAFSWQAVPDSTWYLFWLGKGTPTALVMQQWYTAEQAGCAAGGTCTISITPPINAGSHTWFIQTWAAGLTGPWSAGMQFVLKDPVQNWSSRLPDTRRFTLVFKGEAVLDNETGLTWDRTPISTTATWANALDVCNNIARAERKGWRLPTIAELQTLLIAGPDGGSLPYPHPFILSGGGDYWSQSYSADGVNRMVLYISPAYAGGSSVLALHHGWCVRSPAATIY